MLVFLDFSVTCEGDNGGCSHECRRMRSGASMCFCPDGLHLTNDSHTCIGTNCMLKNLTTASYFYQPFTSFFFVALRDFGLSLLNFDAVMGDDFVLLWSVLTHQWVTVRLVHFRCQRMPAATSSAMQSRVREHSLQLHVLMRSRLLPPPQSTYVPS